MKKDPNACSLVPQTHMRSVTELRASDIHVVFQPIVSVETGETFALIVNEYSLVVGLITLKDVMSIVMGDLVSPWYEEQIVRRDDHSWLIDGVTAIQDVKRALDIDSTPQEEEYETLAGFLMTMLRRVPKRTDSVTWGGYTFEVVDVDSYRIDQVLVTRAGDGPTAAKPPVDNPVDPRG